MGGHFGFDDAGADGVDADSIGGEFTGTFAGETDQSGFAGDVAGTLCNRDVVSGDGGDVEDHAFASGFHDASGGSASVESGTEIDIYRAAPFIIGHVKD